MDTDSRIKKQEHEHEPEQAPAPAPAQAPTRALECDPDDAPLQRKRRARAAGLHELSFSSTISSTHSSARGRGTERRAERVIGRVAFASPEFGAKNAEAKAEAHAEAKAEAEADAEAKAPSFKLQALKLVSPSVPHSHCATVLAAAFAALDPLRATHTPHPTPASASASASAPAPAPVDADADADMDVPMAQAAARVPASSIVARSVSVSVSSSDSDSDAHSGFQSSEASRDASSNAMNDASACNVPKDEVTDEGKEQKQEQKAKANANANAPPIIVAYSDYNLAETVDGPRARSAREHFPPDWATVNLRALRELAGRACNDTAGWARGQARNGITHDSRASIVRMLFARGTALRLQAETVHGALALWDAFASSDAFRTMNYARSQPRWRTSKEEADMEADIARAAISLGIDLTPPASQAYVYDARIATVCLWLASKMNETAYPPTLAQLVGALRAEGDVLASPTDLLHMERAVALHFQYSVGLPTALRFAHYAAHMTGATFFELRLAQTLLEGVVTDARALALHPELLAWGALYAGMAIARVSIRNSIKGGLCKASSYASVAESVLDASNPIIRAVHARALEEAPESARELLVSPDLLSAHFALLCPQ